MEKIWSLDILWYPIHESSEKQMFDWKAMYNHVISNLNSEELVLGLEWKSKIVIFIIDEAEKFGAFNIFVWRKKFGHLTFYGTQYMNLVKSRCSTEKLCTIVSSAT